MSALIKLVAFVLLCYLLYIFLFRSGKRPEPGRGASQKPEEMKLDPSCNTFIPKSQALQREIDGVIHYFCSEKCYRDFLARHKE
jgi:YHS domain-containing protein